MARTSRMQFSAATIVFGILLSLGSAVFAAATSEGRVSQITLYRGQALVTRLVPVEGKAGSVEIVIGKLPEQIVPDSLFAEGGDAVEIRAVRFRTRAVGEQPRDEVRKLDREILEVEQQIDHNKKQQELLGKRTEYLGKMDGFVVPTAHNASRSR
jgi:hypothetical protein